MREDEKQALIEHARLWIKNTEDARDEIPFGFSDDVEAELTLVKIALASLTADDEFDIARAAIAKALGESDE